MKCYGVTAELAEGTEIVFAPDATKARQMALGSDTLNNCEYIELRAKRYPEFDSYAPGPVPVEVLLANGWWWPCSRCGKYVYKSDPHHIIHKGDVWCSQECWDNDTYYKSLHADSTSDRSKGPS